MPVSLLTLPYELREQILTTLLSHKTNIRLQDPVENRAIYTSPITQVCKPLREEAIRVFYQVNAFTWTVDPEETELPDPTTYALSTENNDGKNHNTTLTSTLPCEDIARLQSIRYLRLNISLPNPYSRKTWQTTLASQLTDFGNAINKGHRLKEFKVLLSSWHYFREICDWQTDVLAEGLGQLEVKGNVQVRGRGFEMGVRKQLGEVGLAGRMMGEGGGGRIRGREVSELSCGSGGEDVDWEWEGGVAL